jgi:hypothetical protein
MLPVGMFFFSYLLRKMKAHAEKEMGNSSGDFGSACG